MHGEGAWIHHGLRPLHAQSSASRCRCSLTKSRALHGPAGQGLSCGGCVLRAWLLAWWQVLVMSYPTYRMHKAAVCAKKPDLLICDEAHFLKNSASQTTEVGTSALTHCTWVLAP